MFKKIIYFNLSLLILFSFSCSNILFSPNDNPLDPVEYTIDRGTITLEWEMFNINTEENGNYKIYIKDHNSDNWLLIDEVSDDLPFYILDSSLVEPGIYDIGVSHLNMDGTESQIFCSLDDIAKPSRGWYINWK